MKLLFLITDLRHGGVEKVLVNLVNNLNPQKYDISVQTIFDTGIHRQNIKPHVHYLPGFKWQFPGNSHLLKRIPASMLYSFMIRDNYDVIISYLEGIPARVVSGCKHPSVKKVTWIHTGFENAQLKGQLKMRVLVGDREVCNIPNFPNENDAKNRNLTEVFICDIRREAFDTNRLDPNGDAVVRVEINGVNQNAWKKGWLFDGGRLLEVN